MLLRRPFRLMLRAAAALSVAAAALWLVGNSDRVSLHPGPTTDLVAHVRGDVRDGTFAEHGPVRMTTVEIRKMRNWEVLVAKLPWRDDDTAPAVATSPESVAAGIRQMEASKVTAALAATAVVDGPDALDGYAVGAQVVRIADGSAAEHAGVAVGDVIAALEGQPVDSDTGLLDALAGRSPGEAVTLEVRRGTDSRDLAAVLGDDGRLGVEVATSYGGTPPLRVGTRGVGGASAGLMMTLAFVDALSEGDLTAGLDLAGTGTIALDGTVGTVRGVRHKVAAASAAGAQVFFTPAEAESDARRAAAVGIEVVAVSDVTDALRWLCDNGATDAVCRSVR